MRSGVCGPETPDDGEAEEEGRQQHARRESGRPGREEATQQGTEEQRQTEVAVAGNQVGDEELDRPRW
jgi:hypothetical protein